MDFSEKMKSIEQKAEGLAKSKVNEMIDNKEMKNILSQMNDGALMELGRLYRIPLLPNYAKAEKIKRILPKITRSQLDKFILDNEMGMKEQKTVEHIIDKPAEKTKIIQEKKENVVKDKQFHDVVKLLKKIPVLTNKIRDEHELEVACYTYLQNNLKNVHMEQNFSRGRLDLSIGKKIAIELKFVKKVKTLQDAYGQIDKYADTYKHIILFYLNAGNISSEDTKYWEKKIKKIKKGCIEIISK